ADGIRDFHVTGVQTCALPISLSPATLTPPPTTLPLHSGQPTPVAKSRVRSSSRRIAGASGSLSRHYGSRSDSGCWFLPPFCRVRSEERRVGKECSSRWLQCAQ